MKVFYISKYIISSIYNREQCSDLNIELEAGRKRLAEASAETTRANQRTARLQADLTRLSQQLDLERSQQKLQVNYWVLLFLYYIFIFLEDRRCAEAQSAC